MNRLENIQKLAEKYSLKSYQTMYVLQVEQEVGFAEKSVLEVGGSLPREFVFEALGVKSWIAIEYIQYYIDAGFEYPGGEVSITFDEIKNGAIPRGYEVINGKIEDLPYHLFSSFDLVFSVATLQHLHAIPAATEKIFQSLKLGGAYCALAAPVWSCYNGHFFNTKKSPTGKEYNYHESCPVPPWGHLLMRPPQMYNHLCRTIDFDTAAAITYEIYNSSRINRFFLEDYLNFLKLSPFSQGHFRPMPPMSIPEDIQAKLEALYPGYQNFSYQGFSFTLYRDRE
jgi:SAM-dependent methyltransferase